MAEELKIVVPVPREVLELGERFAADFIRSCVRTSLENAANSKRSKEKGLADKLLLVSGYLTENPGEGKGEGAWFFHHLLYDFVCSNCGKTPNNMKDPDDVFKEPDFLYCPYCGVKMRREGTE